MKPRAQPHILNVILLLCVSFLSVMFLRILPAQATISFKQLMKTHHAQILTGQDILARARLWTSTGVSYDRNPPYDGPGSYRKDCSGMVSMVWGLSNSPGGGLDTTGLATVSQQISNDELQPGDILLNTQADAHAAIFGGWIDANGNITTTPTDRYDALEENGGDGYGKAVEHTIPYPYYSAYFPEDYVPMRLNSLSTTPTPSTPTSTIKPGGLWISPPSPNNGDTVTDVIHFAAHAYPTHPGDPAIAKVNFTVNSQGSWQIARTVTTPINGDEFACDVNLKDLGVPYGQIQVSFDVYDQSGNVNYAPNGVHTLTYAQTPQPVPTPTQPPTPTPRVNSWISPQDGLSIHYGQTLTLSIYAYPENSGGSIQLVFFPVYVQGSVYSRGCSASTPQPNTNIYTCTWDLRGPDGSFIPPGSAQIKFDVLDNSGREYLSSDARTIYISQ